MNDVARQFYKNNNDIWGLSQTFKEINLCPILIQDGDYYNLMNWLLTYPKHIIKDKDIIKMSYLKFLIACFGEDPDRMIEEIKKLLFYITKAERIQFSRSFGNDIRFIDFYFIIDDVKIDEYDFDCIREIILEQNGLSIEYVNDFNQELEVRLHRHQQGSRNGTFEELLFSLCTYLRKTVNDESIRSLTFYQFYQQLKRINILFDYEIYRPLEASGQIEFKHDKLKHWLEHSEDKGRYSDILISKEKYMQNDFMEVLK